MTISKALNENLDKFNLLKHPFYVAWNEGTLSIEILQKYVTEYYHHVVAFPHYVNKIRLLCPNQEDKDVLEDNLLDELGLKDSTLSDKMTWEEENCQNKEDKDVLKDNLLDELKLKDFTLSDKTTWGKENHPELWLRFSEGIGGTRDMKDEPELESTKKLVNGYFDLVRNDYATGLGALYAYERQTPAIAKSKANGLKCHYNVNDEETLKFFTVHQEIDEWHREQLEWLISKLSSDEKKRFEIGAVAGAKLLYEFLDGMNVINCH